MSLGLDPQFRRGAAYHRGTDEIAVWLDITRPQLIRRLITFTPGAAPTDNRSTAIEARGIPRGVQRPLPDDRLREIINRWFQGTPVDRLAAELALPRDALWSAGIGHHRTNQAGRAAAPRDFPRSCIQPP